MATLWYKDGHLIINEAETALVACETCPCGASLVLLWDIDNDPLSGSGPSYARLESWATARGITAHRSDDWTENLADYKLIFFLCPIDDPVWWGEITGETWGGRLVLAAENSNFPDSATWVNFQSAMTGISVSLDLLNAFHEGEIQADPLTAGLDFIWYGATSTVSGGTILSETDPLSGFPNEDFISHNKPGAIDFVVAGDSDIFAPPTTENDGFFDNLYDVAI